MSNLVKVINVRQLEADLLDESPPSEDDDRESEASSDLPELDTRTVEAMLRDLSPTPEVDDQDEEEIVRIQWNPLVRVNCPPMTDRTPVTGDRSSVSTAKKRRADDEMAALAAAVGFPRVSKEGANQQSAGKKKNKRQQRSSRNAAAVSRPSGHRHMEDWMPQRGEEEETQEYLNRIFRAGEVTPEQFYDIVDKINNKN